MAFATNPEAAELAAALDKVRATLASAGFRGWRLEWTARDVCQRVLDGERVAVLSLRESK